MARPDRSFTDGKGMAYHGVCGRRRKTKPAEFLRRFDTYVDLAGAYRGAECPGGRNAVFRDTVTRSAGNKRIGVTP